MQVTCKSKKVAKLAGKMASEPIEYVENCSNYANNAARVTILVSMDMFLTMPDTMKPYKLRFNMQETCKSNMATKMAAKMAAEPSLLLRRNFTEVIVL